MSRVTEPAKRALADLHRNAEDFSLATVRRLWDAEATRRARIRFIPAFASYTAGHQQMVQAVTTAAREDVLEVERTFHATVWSVLDAIDTAGRNLDHLNISPSTRRWLSTELASLAQIIEDGLEGRTP